jgi:Xaa-Pro aminopeptidase
VCRVLVESISEGIEAIRPGIKGCEVDEVVRGYILKQGYPDYNHSTGHAIGELAHNPGALLGREKNELAQLRIQPNGVYTIEPRIAIVNGGSIEEMVLVRDGQAETLCKRQMSIYLIQS